MSSFDQDVLRMYRDENKSTYEIAEALNTYPNKIRRTLLKHGCELKDRSEAQRNALKKGRIDHPTAGRKRSYEERLKISAALDQYWGNLGDDERERRAKIAKDRWADMSESQRAAMAQAATESIRKAGKDGSKLENFLLRKITDAGFRVEFHKKNLIANEKLEIDLYVPECKTIIEIDGPSHFLPVWGDEKLQKQIKADLQKSGLILSKGFAIIRVKVMGFLSLNDQENLATDLINHLKRFKDSFPPRSERYYEIEYE